MMRKFRLIALCVFICLALAACDNSQGDSSSGSNSASSTPGSDTVALYIGEEPVYYAEFNFHVVTQINTYAASEEGQANGYDPNLPLSEQYYPDSELTLEEMFTETVTTELQNTISMYLESKANGYEMGDSEKEYIESFFDNLNTYIEEEGITEEQAFLNKYGVEMSHDQVTSILERNLVGKAYETLLREQMDFTDQELETFYEEHKNEVVLPDCNVVSIRLINFGTEQMALDVLEKFENGDKSEESFIDLVKQYSSDEQEIENGGLYTDLSPGSYDVSSFDEVESWVFDNARELGDYTVLETDDGYGLVYFVEKGDPIWMMWSRYAKANYDIQSIIDNYPVSYPEG